MFRLLAGVLFHLSLGTEVNQNFGGLRSTWPKFFRLCETFLWNFFSCLQWFDIPLQIGFSQSPKGPTFKIFSIVRFVKIIIFLLKIKVFQHALYELCFKVGVFARRLLSKFYRTSPRFVLEGVVFRVFVTMRLTGDLYHFFSEIFLPIFSFLRSFRVSSWKKKEVDIESYAHPLRYFWHSKLMKFQEKCLFAYVKNLSLVKNSLNLERGADLGRSRLGSLQKVFCESFPNQRCTCFFRSPLFHALL